MPLEMSQGKFWCFTLNNPTHDEGVQLRINAQGDNVVYLVFQEELGAAGTRHFQGYVEFTSNHRLTAAKTALGSDRFHMELRRGTGDEARNYCMKAEGRCSIPEEFGVFVASAQGKRSDLDKVQEEMKSGKRYKALAMDNFRAFARYSNGLGKLYHVYNAPIIRPKPEIQFITGATGTGKSTYVKHIVDIYDITAYWYNDNHNGWFDGYDGEEYIILDEFAGLTPLNTMLRLFDNQPLQVQVKGSYVAIHASKFIVTTNLSVYDLYRGNAQHAAFERRINDFKVEPPTDVELASAVEAMYGTSEKTAEGSEVPPSDSG